MVTLGEFLCERLYQAGVQHLFGVPGDFSLGLFNFVIRSKIEYVGTCNELNAAYAADGYARVKGIGACASTYAVGELSALNGVAGCWAESVPVVCLVGAPARRFFQEMPLLHHTLGDYMIPMKMFTMITCAQTMLSDPSTCAIEIDRVLNACIREKKPIYVGVPSDMIKQEIVIPALLRKNPSVCLATESAESCDIAPFAPLSAPESDREALAEAVDEIVARLRRAKQPILIPGVDLIRRRLNDKVKKLVETLNVPYATMLLAKGILNEDHPHFIGLYSGNRSRKAVREYIDRSDCVLIVGERLTDFNTGGFTAMFNLKTRVLATYDAVSVSSHTYNKVYIEDMLDALIAQFEGNPLLVDADVQWPVAIKGCVHRKPTNGDEDIFTAKLRSDLSKSTDDVILDPVEGVFIRKAPETSAKLSIDEDLTMDHVFERAARLIPERAVILAETGASLFSAAETMLPKGSIFIGQTFYGSIGYSVGACLGASVAAKSENRQVMLFVGDGSFQVTAQDLSTMYRYKCTPTVFLINNDGYTIERVITDNVYNDIQAWKYSDLPRTFGGQRRGIKVHTKREFELALQSVEAGWKDAKNAVLEPRMIEVVLDRWDCNDLLKEAGRTMARNNDLP